MTGTWWFSGFWNFPDVSSQPFLSQVLSWAPQRSPLGGLQPPGIQGPTSSSVRRVPLGLQAAGRRPSSPRDTLIRPPPPHIPLTRAPQPLGPPLACPVCWSTDHWSLRSLSQVTGQHPATPRQVGLTAQTPPKVIPFSILSLLHHQYRRGQGL